MRRKFLEPSLLAADPYGLGASMEAAERGGAAAWHLDIMDGHFVPNLSFGPHICAGLRKHTNLPFTAHLMVQSPSRFIRPFLDAGAASVVLHVESETRNNLYILLDAIQKAGAVPGLALHPKTPVEAVLPYLPVIGKVLLLSVAPGYGGQAFLTESYERIRAVRELLKNYDVTLTVDGGVTLQNAPEIIGAGADGLVAGSSVFETGDVEARCREFAGLLNGA